MVLNVSSQKKFIIEILVNNNFKKNLINKRFFDIINSSKTKNIIYYLHKEFINIFGRLASSQFRQNLRPLVYN